MVFYYKWQLWLIQFHSKKRKEIQMREKKRVSLNQNTLNHWNSFILKQMVVHKERLRSIVSSVTAIWNFKCTWNPHHVFIYKTENFFFLSSRSIFLLFVTKKKNHFHFGAAAHRCWQRSILVIQVWVVIECFGTMTNLCFVFTS